MFVSILNLKSKSRWVRAQELGALVNCILLISLCLTIFIQALKRVIVVELIDQSKLQLYIIVGIVGLCINVIALLVLGSDMAHGHSHGNSRKAKPVDPDRLEIGEGEEGSSLKVNGNGHCHAAVSEPKKKKKHGSRSFEKRELIKRERPILVDGGQMNIRGAFLHVLNDAIGSVIVVIAGLAMRLWPDKAWVNYIDPAASLVLITLIVIFTIPLRTCLLLILDHLSLSTFTAFSP